MKHLLALIILYLIMASLTFFVGSLPADSPLFTSTVLGFLMLASLFLGKVVGKAGLPLITGYLFCGMLFGPWGIELFSTEDVKRLGFINHLALALIALSAGAELKLGSIKKLLKKIIAISVSQMTIIFAGVSTTFYFIFQSGRFDIVPQGDIALYAAIILGVIATANSPSSVVAIIGELKAHGPVSQTVLSVSVIKDVFVIALFAFVVSFILSSSGGLVTVSAVETFGAIISETLLSMLAGTVIGTLVIAYLKRFRKEQLLFILGLAVVCSAISAFLHLNELLMCIMVGFIVRNFLEEGIAFEKWLEKGSTPIFVIFFSLAGASLDLNAFMEMWPAAIIYFAVRLATVWASTSAVAALCNEPEKIKKHLWSGFTPQAGVSLGLATIVAEQFPGWGEGLVILIMATIVINQIVGPIIFKFSLLACGEDGKDDYNK